MRHSVLLTAVLSALSFAHVAQAEEAKSPWTVTTNMGFVSDYIARGISQSWNKPAVQGGIDVTHASGFYAGAWGSSISPQTYVDSTTEIDIYGGYNGSVPWVEGLGWTTGLIGYIYPGGDWSDCSNCTLADGVTPVTTNQRFDTYEANAGLSYGWLSAKASVTLSEWYGANKNTGFKDSSKGTTYIELNANYPLPWYGLTLVAHVGMLDVATKLTPGALSPTFTNGDLDPDYVDYKIGLSKAFAIANADGFNAGVYFTGANGTGYWNNRGFGGSSFNNNFTDSKNIGGDRVIVTLGRTF